MLLHSIDRFEWEKVVRVVVMPPTTKLVALALATYSNRRGGNIHPGNKRLALELCVSPRTIERAIEWLRSHGLLEQTFQGRSAGRRGLANAYQLVVAEDLPDRVTFAVTPDTGDASSARTSPDTTVGSSTGTPDVGVGSFEPITRHDGPEHPTPVTGTPDTSDRTPDTGDDPSRKYQQDSSSSSESSSADSIAEPGKRLFDELAIVKRLPPDDQARLMNDLTTEVGEDVAWETLIHLAAERIVSESVA